MMAKQYSWTTEVAVVGSTRSFLIYITFFMGISMIIWPLLQVMGIGIAAAAVGFVAWYQNQNNPGAIKFYLEYVLIPNHLDGNLSKGENLDGQPTVSERAISQRCRPGEQ